jgi:DNA mismatch repair protein MutS2
MISITEKTLQDLQFPTVLETISTICNTDIGKKSFRNNSFKDKDTLMRLMQTSEYVSSFQNNAIPNHGFDAITHEIKFLAIEDSFLK